MLNIPLWSPTVTNFVCSGHLYVGYLLNNPIGMGIMEVVRLYQNISQIVLLNTFNNFMLILQGQIYC